MANPFIWHDLVTPDPQAAAEFYAKVIGWEIKDSGLTDGPPYLVLHVNGHGVGGIMAPMPGSPPMPPSWQGYVGVDDVDACIQKARSLGANLLSGPFDVPHVGRIAVIADTSGAWLLPFKPNGTPPEGETPKPPMQGTIGWNELHGAPPDEAFPFYESLFGWTKSSEMDMGPYGKYLTYAINGVDAGGMMTQEPELPSGTWGYYVCTDSADATAEKIKANGGTIVHGPHQVPTGQWILVAKDPQGAHFHTVSNVR